MTPTKPSNFGNKGGEDRGVDDDTPCPTESRARARTNEESDHDLLLYGPWDRPGADGVVRTGEQVRRWLSGEDVTPTAELLQDIRREFVAQEAYRRRLDAEVAAVGRQIRAITDSMGPTMDVPYRFTEQHLVGYTQGEFRAYMACGQMVANIANAASVALHKARACDDDG